MKKQNGKLEHVGGVKFGKRDNPEENSDIAHNNCPPGDTEIQTRDPNRGQTKDLTARVPGQKFKILPRYTFI